MRHQEMLIAGTTGTISGSDPYPFGLVVTTVGGTPFNPNFGTQPVSQGFFFSRMGADTVSGTNRNLVLLGGAGAAEEEVDRTITSLGLADRVRRPGRVSDRVV